MAGISNSWARCPRCMCRRKAGQKLCKDCIAFEDKARRVTISHKGIHPDAVQITSLAGVDTWRFANPDIDESSRQFIRSRYAALCSLFGVSAADEIMQNLEAAPL